MAETRAALERLEQVTLDTQLFIVPVAGVSAEHSPAYRPGNLTRRRLRHRSSNIYTPPWPGNADPRVGEESWSSVQHRNIGSHRRERPLRGQTAHRIGRTGFSSWKPSRESRAGISLPAHDRRGVFSYQLRTPDQGPRLAASCGLSAGTAGQPTTDLFHVRRILVSELFR